MAAVRCWVVASMVLQQQGWAGTAHRQQVCTQALPAQVLLLQLRLQALHPQQQLLHTTATAWVISPMVGLVPVLSVVGDTAPLAAALAAASQQQQVVL